MEQEKCHRRYSDRQNQVAKVNKTTIIGLTFIELVLIFGLAIQTFLYDTAFGKLGIVPMIILLVGIVVNVVSYNRNKKSDKLRYYMFASFIVGWVYLMVLGTNTMVSFYVYPLVITTILYHDKKFERILYYTITDRGSLIHYHKSTVFHFRTMKPVRIYYFPCGERSRLCSAEMATTVFGSSLF